MPTMAFPGKRTKNIRQAKMKSRGGVSKRKRDNKGSTIRIPLTGPLPAARYGMAIDPSKIVTAEN